MTGVRAGAGASYLLVTLPLLPAADIAAAADHRHRELCNKNRTRRRRSGRRSPVAAAALHIRTQLLSLYLLATGHGRTVSTGTLFRGPEKSVSPRHFWYMHLIFIYFLSFCIIKLNTFYSISTSRSRRSNISAICTEPK